MLDKLKNSFSSRDELINFVASITPHLQNLTYSNEIIGGKSHGEQRLSKIDPLSYCRNRNYLDGSVTKLSAYIRHGIITLKQVRDKAIERVDDPHKIEKFIQELAWRDFWQRIYYANPEFIFNDIEEYKTGFTADDYQNEIPADILSAETPNAAINFFIQQLVETGYLHNHARMYLASYVVHWRRVKWQVGAKWFLHHLIDGDPASNNLSWQWIASTFSNKAYIFNLENVQKYADSRVDCSPRNNPELNFSYEELNAKLFKNA